MKNLLLLIVILLLTSISFAQDAKKDDWIRVQSDDGEFSIEVPANYGYFFDKDGSGHGLAEMCIFNSYFEHTLLSFETFKRPFANSDTINLIKEIKNLDDEFLRKQKYHPVSSELSKAEYKIKQDIFKSEKQYTVRQYFFSKKYIYILTASSRIGETPAIKHFLDSLIFKPDTNTKTGLSENRFPDLKVTSIIFEENLEKVKEKTDKLSANSDSTVKSLFIITQPIVVSSLSPDGFVGNVRLTLDFSEVGQISKIVVREKLKSGFRRDVILTALRMKFLPQEKDDKPMSVTKTIEYEFSRF